MNQLFLTVIVLTTSWSRFALGEIDGDIPLNEVVTIGSGVLLNCAKEKPYRWYRFLPSDPGIHKVIYMGTQMADDAQEGGFRVYKTPEHRLDLFINTVQQHHYGTYKCQNGHGYCAEIIVLSSEPKCRIHYVSKTTVEIRCDLDITENGIPEMECSHLISDFKPVASCHRKQDGRVTCKTQIPADMKADVTCSIKIIPKPIRIDTSCNHAANPPSYSFVWASSSGVVDETLLQSNSFQLFLWVPLIIGAVLVATFVGLLIYVLRIRRLLQKDFPRKRASSSSSTESADTESESLSCVSMEKEKIPDYII